MSGLLHGGSPGLMSPMISGASIPGVGPSMAVSSHGSSVAHKKKGGPLSSDMLSDMAPSGRRKKRRGMKTMMSAGGVHDVSLPQPTSGSVFNDKFAR